LYLSKCGILIFLGKHILFACNYYLKHLQISSWDCNGLGFCEAFYVKSLHCIDEATSSNMFLVNSSSTRAVIPKLGGVNLSGAWKNYGNAPKLNYQLMKLSIYLLTLQNP
jgi:hypothetical protein